jgi:hypothetical protein
MDRKPSDTYTIDARNGEFQHTKCQVTVFGEQNLLTRTLFVLARSAVTSGYNVAKMMRAVCVFNAYKTECENLPKTICLLLVWCSPAKLGYFSFNIIAA